MPDQKELDKILDKVEEILTRNSVPDRAQVVVTAYLLGALEVMFHQGYNQGYEHARSEPKR